MPSDSLRIVTRNARASFRERYGTAPRFITASPGRINLIGEHTDYNYGYVLPMAVDRWCVCLAEPLPEAVIEVASMQRDYVARIPLDPELSPAQDENEASWANAIRGVVVGFLQRGTELPGLRVLIDSNIPPGSGLASSASVAVSFASLLEATTSFPLDPLDLALLCQKAEQDFAGVPCGIMDQYVCCQARVDCALLIDCESLTHRHVPLHEGPWTFLCLDSGVRHDLTDGQYAQRRRECEQAAQLLKRRKLRHVNLDDLEGEVFAANPLLKKRAHHVVSENERTLETARLLAQGDWQKIGELMNQSHRSLADDFEISSPELETLVGLSDKIPAASSVLGARLTGAGFGGSVIYLVAAEQAETIATELMDAYAQTHPEAAAASAGWLISRPTEGCQVLTSP